MHLPLSVAGEVWSYSGARAPEKLSFQGGGFLAPLFQTPPPLRCGAPKASCPEGSLGDLKSLSSRLIRPYQPPAAVTLVPHPFT